MEARNINISLKNILDLDKKNREINSKQRKTRTRKKNYFEKTRQKSIFKRSKEISKEIEILDKSQIKIKNKLKQYLDRLPNLALDDVPIGKDENSNKEIKKVGEIPKFEF